MGGLGWLGGLGVFREGVGVGLVHVPGLLAVLLFATGDGEAVHVQGVAGAEKLFGQAANLEAGSVLVGWLAGNFESVQFGKFYQFGRNERQAKASLSDRPKRTVQQAAAKAAACPPAPEMAGGSLAR